MNWVSFDLKHPGIEHSFKKPKPFVRIILWTKHGEWRAGRYMGSGIWQLELGRHVLLDEDIKAGYSHWAYVEGPNGESSDLSCEREGQEHSKV